MCLGRGQAEDSSLSAVICHAPLSNLGQCRKGSTLSFSVAFQILKPGLYEVCPLWNTLTTCCLFQKFSLKSNCVFCSWVSTWNWSCSSQHQCPIPHLTLGRCHVRTKQDLYCRVFEHSISWSDKLTHCVTLEFSIYHKGKNSPSSPAVRDLLDRHQASLGRSQSFSHQQPSRSHIMRYFTWTPPWFNYY